MPETSALAVPFAVQLAAPLMLIAVLRRRRRGDVPWFEVGLVYTCLVTLYGVYPLIKFLVVGEHASDPRDDVRWSRLDPTLAEMTYIAWIYACHLVAFVATYAIVRGRLRVPVERMRAPGTAVFIAAVALYAIIQVFWFFLGLFYDTSAGSYMETYLVSGRLPLVLAQLLNHLNGARHPLSLVILAGLFARYPASRRIIVAWIAVVAVLTFTRLGNRTELALLVLSAGMLYQILVRPIRPRSMVVGVCSGLVLFTVFGIVRSGWLHAEDVRLNAFLYPGEFDILFGNALELSRARATGALAAVPRVLYFVDFAALIPQQLAPFEKVEAAAWYASTFYPIYAAQGGGLAFGTMAEAVMTGGLLSAGLRGAALGWCFAKVYRFYVHHAGSYWALLFYVWVTTLCYQSFRGTTFVLLVLFVYRFVPVLVGVKLISTAVYRAAHHTRWQNLQAARVQA
jgi:hypothetical protein